MCTRLGALPDGFPVGEVIAVTLREEIPDVVNHTECLTELSLLEAFNPVSDVLKDSPVGTFKFHESNDHRHRTLTEERSLGFANAQHNSGPWGTTTVHDGSAMVQDSQLPEISKPLCKMSRHVVHWVMVVLTTSSGECRGTKPESAFPRESLSIRLGQASATGLLLHEV